MVSSCCACVEFPMVWAVESAFWAISAITCLNCAGFCALICWSCLKNWPGPEIAAPSDDVLLEDELVLRVQFTGCVVYWEGALFVGLIYMFSPETWMTDSIPILPRRRRDHLNGQIEMAALRTYRP